VVLTPSFCQWCICCSLSSKTSFARTPLVELLRLPSPPLVAYAGTLILSFAFLQPSWQPATWASPSAPCAAASFPRISASSFSSSRSILSIRASILITSTSPSSISSSRRRATRLLTSQPRFTYVPFFSTKARLMQKTRREHQEGTTRREEEPRLTEE
jgi:hypothetical protein